MENNQLLKKCQKLSENDSRKCQTPGPDGIPTEISKLFVGNLLPPLSEAFEGAYSMSQDGMLGEMTKKWNITLQ